MEKKILNEELDTMKYLLGYKRGVVISEQTMENPGDTEMCLNYETGKGLEKVNNVKEHIDSLGITDEIKQGETLKIDPKLEDVKNQIDEELTKMLPSMSVEDIKNLILKVKEIKNNPEKAKSMNEQIETAALMAIFASVPVWGWAILGTWIILRLLRCLIYKLESKLFRCAFSWKKSPLAFITFLLFLDFKNMKRGNTIYGCR